MFRRAVHCVYSEDIFFTTENEEQEESGFVKTTVCNSSQERHESTDMDCTRANLGSRMADRRTLDCGGARNKQRTTDMQEMVNLRGTMDRGSSVGNLVSCNRSADSNLNPSVYMSSLNRVNSDDNFKRPIVWKKGVEESIREKGRTDQRLLESHSLPTSPSMSAKFGNRSNSTNSTQIQHAAVGSRSAAVPIPSQQPLLYMHYGYVLWPQTSESTKSSAQVYDSNLKVSGDSLSFGHTHGIYNEECERTRRTAENRNQNYYDHKYGQTSTYMNQQSGMESQDNNFRYFRPVSPSTVRHPTSPPFTGRYINSQPGSPGSSYQYPMNQMKSHQVFSTGNENTQGPSHPTSPFHTAKFSVSRPGSPGVYFQFSQSVSDEHMHYAENEDHCQSGRDTLHYSGSKHTGHSVQSPSSPLLQQNLETLQCSGQHSQWSSSSSNVLSVPVIQLTSHTSNSDDSQSNISSLPSSPCMCPQCVDILGSPPSPQKSPRKNWSLRKFLLDRMLASSPHSSVGSNTSQGSRGSAGDMYDCPSVLIFFFDLFIAIQ